MPLNSIWLDSRLNELSLESKNTHNGVITEELCKLQAVTKISNLQHLQQQQQPLSFIIFGDLNFIICDAPIPGRPLTTRQPAETLVNVG